MPRVALGGRLDLSLPQGTRVGLRPDLLSLKKLNHDGSAASPLGDSRHPRHPLHKTNDHIIVVGMVVAIYQHRVPIPVWVYYHFFFWHRLRTVCWTFF